MTKTDEEGLIFTVNYDALLQTGVSVNQFLFLQLIHNQKSQRYYQFYLEQFPEGQNIGVQYLIDKGLLELIDKSRGSLYTNFRTTKLFKNLFDKDVESAIEDLKETYPKQTPAKKRRLQSDQHKWGPKYQAMVKNKPELHQFILKCIKAEIKHRKSTNSEEFWPLLTTYINNKRWEDYAEEVLKMGDSEIALEEVNKEYDI